MPEGETSEVVSKQSSYEEYDERFKWIALIDDNDDGSCGCSKYRGVHKSVGCLAGYGISPN